MDELIIPESIYENGFIEGHFFTEFLHLEDTGQYNRKVIAFIEQQQINVNLN